VTNLENELEKLNSEWNAKCNNLSSKLTATKNRLEEATSCRDKVAAQLEEQVRSCDSIEEKLTATQKSFTDLEGLKQQLFQEAVELKQQLRLTQEEVDAQRADKERGLEKAEVR